MKKLLILPVLILLTAFSFDSPPMPTAPGKSILTATFGGTNAGAYEMDSVTYAKGWNINTLEFESVLYGHRQFNSSSGRNIGLQVPLAQKMHTANSGDTLYFVDYHVINSSIDTWNVHTGINFFKFIYHLDQALATTHVSKINFIFMDGERDCQSSVLAAQFKQSEFEIFKYIRDKYEKTLGYSITIINYRLPYSLNPANYPKANRITINAAKDLNLAQGACDYLIKSDSLAFNADKATLSKASGIVKFADSIMTKSYR